MDIGIFGAFILLLVIGWLPLVVLLTLICIIAIPITYLISQNRVSTSTLLSNYFILAATIFTPCQILFLKFIVYGSNARDFSWWIAFLYSGIGVLLFMLLSRATKGLSTTR
jgi:hypothetical protein